jgi:hypothetical protein
VVFVAAARGDAQEQKCALSGAGAGGAGTALGHVVGIGTTQSPYTCLPPEAQSQA